MLAPLPPPQPSAVDWRLIPRAAELLDLCAQWSPGVTFHRETYAVTADEWVTYSRHDVRVRALHDIFEAEATLLLAEGDHSGNYDAFKAMVPVDRAIDEAIAARAEGRRG